MKISVVIATHSEVQLLEQCLAALNSYNINFKKHYEVIVVDNGSEHTAKIEQLCMAHNTKLIKTGKNLEVSLAYTQGIKLATGEYIMLMDDDIVPIAKDGLERAYKFIKSKKKAAVVGFKLLFPDGVRVQHGGIVFDQYRKLGFKLQGTEKNDPRINEPREMQAVSFACALLDTKILKAMGGFSPLKPGLSPHYYFNDIDYCLKVRKEGYEVWYCPDLLLWHYGGATFNKLLPGPERMKFLPMTGIKWFDEIEHDDYIHRDMPPHNPVVAVGVALSDHSRWIFPRLMNMIAGLNYYKKNMIIMLSMTNVGKDFYEEIETYARLNGQTYKDFMITNKYPHFENKMDSVYHNREKIREMAIAKKADYLFFIDSDVSMERDTLKKLVCMAELEDCDIAAGSYFYKSEDNPKPMLFAELIPTAEFMEKGLNDKVKISSDEKTRVCGLGNFRLGQDLMDGKKHYAGATNMGCTLISRKCFETISFKQELCYGTEDLSWFAKASHAGYKLKVDTSLKLYHLDPDGFVYSWWGLPVEYEGYRYYLKPVKEKISDGIHN